MCQRNHNCCESQSSGFIFGLICGAIIGAVIAIYFYKNSKSDVFVDLQKKLTNFFKDFTQAPKSVKKVSRVTKKSVILPPALSSPPPSQPKPKAKAKLFRK